MIAQRSYFTADSGYGRDPALQQEERIDRGLGEAEAKLNPRFIIRGHIRHKPLLVDLPGIRRDEL
jgi:hypothetical protein